MRSRHRKKERPTFDVVNVEGQDSSKAATREPGGGNAIDTRVHVPRIWPEASITTTPITSRYIHSTSNKDLLRDV